MLEFTFWDVQHGSAAYICTPNKTHFVVDLGTGSYGNSNSQFSPLLHLKNKYQISKIDCVIITHPHRDHMDDILHFDELSPGALLRPRHLTEDDIRNGNRSEDKKIIDEYLKINSRYDFPIENGKDPFSANNNGGVSIDTYIPKSCARTNLNNHSIVTIFTYLGFNVAFFINE